MLLAFHNRSSYDYYFIIKEVPEEFENQFICWGEITKKYIASTVSIKNIARIDKNGEEIAKNVP